MVLVVQIIEHSTFYFHRSQSYSLVIRYKYRLRQFLHSFVLMFISLTHALCVKCSCVPATALRILRASAPSLVFVMYFAGSQKLLRTTSARTNKRTVTSTFAWASGLYSDQVSSRTYFPHSWIQAFLFFIHPNGELCAVSNTCESCQSLQSVTRRQGTRYGIYFVLHRMY
jgi:hypothetical protein